MEQLCSAIFKCLGQGQGQEKAEKVSSNRIVEYGDFCL